MKFEFFKRSFLISLLIFLGISFYFPQTASADFILSPAKVEITMMPGERRESTVTIVNQNSAQAEVTISFEDFVAQPNSYSLIPYLSSPSHTIKLAAGESIQVPIMVSLPLTPSVGSFYGAIIFSFTPIEEERGISISAVSRLGALFLVRLNGVEAQPSGVLSKFGLLSGAWLKENQSPVFYLNYTNRGNIYLNPYGIISLTNYLTGAKLIQTIDSWFVLPENSRTREIAFVHSLTIGWYHASLKLNRGYADIVDEETISFLVWSWPLIISLITGLIVSTGAVWFIINRIRK